MGIHSITKLTAAGVKCVILAPTTMLTPQGVRIKTDMGCIYDCPVFVIWWLSCLGLAPGENSSSDSIHRLGITKAGNSHLRQLLIEASGGIYERKEMVYPWNE